MKFKINRDQFTTGLQQVFYAVSGKPSIPILNNVLIRAESGQVTLTTTNLDLGIRSCIHADVERTGEITLPLRKLATIVKALPSHEVEVDTSNGNQAKITSGGSLFRIMGIPADNFPALDFFTDQHVFELPQDEFLKSLKSVSYAQSQDKNRNILNGVYLVFGDNKLTLVATDGRRLALVSHNLVVTESNAGQLILPAKTINELERLLGQGKKVKITFSKRQVAFEIQIGDEEEGLVETIYVVSKVVEGNYPNYHQVIPKETKNRVVLERELLLECVQRASLIVSDKNTSIKLKVSENLLEITGYSPEHGEFHESMAIAYEGDKVQVAFKPGFLLDPLRSLSRDEVYFEFKDEFSPGVLKTLDSFLCVIMPLRLNPGSYEGEKNELPQEAKPVSEAAWGK